MTNEQIHKVLDSFDMLLPDSQYIRWALKFLYGIRLKDRVYGPALFLKTCQLSEKKHFSIFLCSNNTSLLINKLNEKFPHLKIKGWIELNNKPVDMKATGLLENKLKKLKPDILIVGIGSPAQHLLINKLKTVNIPIIAIGGASDFISGAKKQAPRWMQNLGFEWLFRLFQEPIRLWKRYFIYAPLFLFFVLLQKLKRK